MDYKQNRRYFETINWIIVAVLGVFIAGLLYFYIWIGLIGLLGLGTYIYFKIRNMPTDEDIDAVCKEHAQIIFQKGYEKLGITPDLVSEMGPLLIHGPDVQQISYDPAIKRGKDHRVRSSNYNINIFYFGDKQIYCYHHRFSLIDDERNETMSEYLYKDIVSISTTMTTTMYEDSHRKRDDFFELDAFNITTRDGSSLKCPIKNIQTIQDHLFKMKQLIREKKAV